MHKKDTSQFPLFLGALGVVFGDIGTSPLYAVKSCFYLGNLSINPASVIGLISLIIWLLFLVVTVKYVIFVMRVDEQGEGGILVLSNLVARLKASKKRHIPLVMGIIGGGLFFGDGVITPAISILSALEGIYLIYPAFSGHIVFYSVIVIALLFAFQHRGTQVMGKYFGPIIAFWFITLAVLGLMNIAKSPMILLALSPAYAVEFLFTHGTTSLYVLGGVILAVTGAEALYADMGHFGKRPIRLAWSYVVFPALILNYMGQGGLLLSNPEALSNPFYLMAPSALYYPLIILATVATIIASQAVISGVFSVAWQAMMLGYIPRMKVIHTSHMQRGEVYVPAINTILGVLTVTAVILFQNSEKLASAYGLSVAGVMLLTNVLVFSIAYQKWQWSHLKLAMLFIPLMLLDSVFVATNVVKIFEGAWYALFIAFGVVYIFSIWQKGNRALDKQKYHPTANLKDFLVNWRKKYPQTLPSTAIYMCRSAYRVPNSLMIHLQHNKLLHEKMIFVTIMTTMQPVERGKNKITSRFLGQNSFVITVKYGFKESPDLKKIVHWAEEKGLLEEGEDYSYFLSKGVAVASPRKILSGVGEKVYIYLSKNSLAAYEFYRIPHDKVVELGIRYKI